MSNAITWADITDTYITGNYPDISLAEAWNLTEGRPCTEEELITLSEDTTELSWYYLEQIT